jgi:hypothetical protein
MSRGWNVQDKVVKAERVMVQHEPSNVTADLEEAPKDDGDQESPSLSFEAEEQLRGEEDRISCDEDGVSGKGRPIWKSGHLNRACVDGALLQHWIGGVVRHDYGF